MNVPVYRFNENFYDLLTLNFDAPFTNFLNRIEKYCWYSKYIIGQLTSRFQLWECKMSLKKLALAGGVASALMAGTAYASVIDRPFFQVLGVVVVWGADSAGNAPVVSDFVLLTPASGTAGADLISGDVTAVVTGSLTPISATGVGGAGSDVSGVTAVPAGGGVYADDNANGVLDAGDSLTAFGIDAATDVDGLIGPASHESSFYVASNAAFDIYAESTGLGGSGELFAATNYEDIKLAMSIDVTGNVVDGDATSLEFGSAAQNPTGGDPLDGFVTSVDDLSDINGAASQVFQGGQRTAASVGSLSEQSVRFNSVYTLDSGAGVGGYDLSQGAGTVFADVTYTIFVP